MEHHTSMSAVPSEHQYLPTWHHIPEDSYVQSHQCENLKSQCEMCILSGKCFLNIWLSCIDDSSFLCSYCYKVTSNMYMFCAQYLWNECLMGRSCCVCPSAWFGIRTIKLISVTFDIGQGGKRSTLKLRSNFSIGPVQSNASFTLHDVKKKTFGNFSIVQKALVNHIHYRS